MHISNLYYNEPIIEAGAKLVKASHMEKLSLQTVVQRPLKVL